VRASTLVIEQSEAVPSLEDWYALQGTLAEKAAINNREATNTLLNILTGYDYKRLIIASQNLFHYLTTAEIL